MLCCGFLDYTSNKPEVISLMDYPRLRSGMWDEKALMRDVFREVQKADLWVTHNGVRFDRRFIQTKFMEAGLGPLKPIPHVDNLYTSRAKLLLHSNRLKSIEDWLVSWKGPISGAKTALKTAQWQAAIMGDRRSFQYIIDHCKQDVLVLRDIYSELRPLLQGHPRLYPYPLCGIDGGEMVPRGANRNGRKPSYNLQCATCKHWETRSRLG